MYFLEILFKQFFININIFIGIFPMAPKPPVGQGLLINEASPHNQTHHSR